MGQDVCACFVGRKTRGRGGGYNYAEGEACSPVSSAQK